MHLKLICTVALLCATTAFAAPTDDEEARAKAYMDELNDEFLTRRNTETNASWDYASNITDANLEKRNEISTANAEFSKVSPMSSTIVSIGHESFDLCRMVGCLTTNLRRLE
jgi:Angiotensin-converting enzyme